MIDIYTGLYTLFILLVGYYLGSKRSAEQDLSTIIERTKKKFRDKRVGAIQRPDAATVFNRANPLIEQEKEAVREVFDKIIGQGK